MTIIMIIVTIIIIVIITRIMIITIIMNFFTITDCPYMWPWCRTAIYPTSRPLLINFTIMNSMGKTGRVTQIKWVEYLTDSDNIKDREAFSANRNQTSSRKLHRNRNWIKVRFDEKGFGTVSSSRYRQLSSTNSVDMIGSRGGTEGGTGAGTGGRTGSGTGTGTGGGTGSGTGTGTGGGPHVLVGEDVTLKVQFSDVIYPFSGYIAVSITATDTASSQTQTHNTQGMPQNISGVLYVTVKSPGRSAFTPYDTSSDESRRGMEGWNDVSRPMYLETEGMFISTASAAIDLRISPTPPRSKRILWDVYHNMGYPSAFVPRDDLSTSRFVLLSL